MATQGIKNKTLTMNTDPHVLTEIWECYQPLTALFSLNQMSDI